MKRTVYHVVPRNTEEGLNWAVKRVNTERAAVILENKDDAIRQAEIFARKSELSQIVIHRKDGIIQEERTFGKDPEKYIG